MGGERAYQENIKLEGLCPGVCVVELMLTDDLPISLASSVLQHILQTRLCQTDISLNRQGRACSMFEYMRGNEDMAKGKDCCA